MRLCCLLFAIILGACGATPVAPVPANGDTGGGNGADAAVGNDAATDAGGCIVSSQCKGKTDQCIGGTCVAQIACKGDKDCKDAHLVCEKNLGFCVQCLDKADCVDDQTCNANRCLPPPTACASSINCPDGQVCDKTAKICVECVAANDCADGQSCVQTICIPATCIVGPGKCVSDTEISTCKADGSGFETVKCGDKTLCQDGVCKAQICTPNANACDGDKHVKCDAQGFKSTQVEDCAAKAGNICQNGACVSMACTPGATSCADVKTVATCNAKGFGFDNAACTADQGCINGKCKPKVCTPGASLCDGTQISVCNDSGTASKPTTDCADTKQQCIGGKCAAQLCTPASKKCNANSYQTCSADGMSWAGAACDDANTCTTDTCADASGCKFTPVADPNCGKNQTGYKVHGAFSSVSDTAAGNFKVVDQSWGNSGTCGTLFCYHGGFLP